MGLQPIETAPRDGSRILLARESGYADGYWLASAYNGNGAWIWPYVHKVPLYWMPLPELPSNALAQADAACGVSPGAMGSAAD